MTAITVQPDLATFSGLAIYLIVFTIIFVETGLLVGLLLPGDSILFAAGLLAANGDFGVSILVLTITVLAAAVLGDSVGYALGRRYGRRYLVRGLPRRGARFVAAAERLYARHGAFAICVTVFVGVSGLRANRRARDERRDVNRGPGELERAIMNVLWAQPEPVTARSVLRELGDAELAYTTVKTVLDRLHRKRLVHREPAQRAWRYRAAGSRDDHVAELMLLALDQTGDRDGALIRFARAVSDTDADVLRHALADVRGPTGQRRPSQRDRPGRADS